MFESITDVLPLNVDDFVFDETHTAACAEHTRRDRLCTMCGEPASRYLQNLCADCASILEEKWQ